MRKLPLLLISFFLFSSISVLLKPSSVLAWTGYPTTEVGLLPQTQWTDQLADNGIAGFNASSTKYVVFNSSGMPYEPQTGEPSTIRHHLICTNTNDIEFVTISGQSSFRSTTPFACKHIYYYTDDLDAVIHVNSWPVTGTLSNGFYVMSDMTKIGYAVNAKFNANYQSTKGVNDVPLLASKECQTLEFSCWFSAIGDNITGAVSGIAQNILKGFAFLFQPDGAKISEKFNGLTTSLTNKMGFAAYPVQFFGDIFGAFNQSSSGCSQASCIRNFGNLMGSNMTVNVSQMGVTAPSLWNWFLLMMRGTTIVAVILMARRKYMKVMEN